MKEIINFLVEVSKLKETPRTGWVLMKVKNPETIAEHTFRLAVLSWLLAEKANLNIKRAIKIALFHDLCEVYSGDLAPVLYYPRLPKEKQKRMEILKKWARLSRAQKEKIGDVKFEREKRAFVKLAKFLELNLRAEFLSLGLKYKKRISKECRFVAQLNRIETLLQAIDYFGTKDVKKRTNWWEWTEEIVDDPLLLKFLKTIQNKFYGKVAGYKQDKNLENILDFIMAVGRLKKMPRLYWLLKEVKNPETVASHMFTLALMAWIFDKEKNINIEKILKMALCHEMSAVYTGDTTPYDRILPRGRREKREVLRQWPHVTKIKKEKIFLSDYKEEKQAMERLTKKLEPSLRKEMIQLWKEYRTKSSPEGRLLSQINVLAVLMQALLYEKGNKNHPAAPIWEWAFESCDNETCFEFLEEAKRKFYK